MMKKIVIKTNLDNATQEQREKFMNNLVEAYRTLYKSVVERHIRQLVGKQ